jgi:hypothetical protein
MVRILLVLALIATLVATWFAPGETDDGIELSARVETVSSAAVERRQSQESSRSKRGENIEVLQIDPRGEAGDEGALLFAPISWAPPKMEAAPIETITVPVVEPVEAPRAPPLPFQVLGRYVDGERALVFLQHMDQNLAVAVGDTIGDTYQVERLEGNTLVLRYLPLDELQTLEVGRIQ